MFWMRNKENNLTNTLLSGGLVMDIAHDKRKNMSEKMELFAYQSVKHLFWLLKRTVSLRGFYLVPTTYVLVEN